MAEDSGMTAEEKVVYILRRSFHETPNDQAMSHIARSIIGALNEPVAGDDPIAYAVYGRSVGRLRHLAEWDEDEFFEASEHYRAVPLYRRQEVRAEVAVQGEPTDANQVTDAQADAAQIAFREFVFGPDAPSKRELGIARQGWKVALAAAAAVREEGQER